MVINHIEKLYVTNDAATILKELEVSYNRTDNLFKIQCISHMRFSVFLFRMVPNRNIVLKLVNTNKLHMKYLMLQLSPYFILNLQIGSNVLCISKIVFLKIFLLIS